MDNDINMPDDTITEVEAPPVKKAVRKDITDTQSDVSAEEYREFKTPLPMHTLTQTSKEVPLSWTNFTTEQYEDKLSKVGLFATPNEIGDKMWARPGADWQQTLQGVTIEMGCRPKGMALSGAHQLLSALTGTGTPISLLMPGSGFYVSFTAPDETDLCDYDFTWGLESAIVGTSSTGMLLNAASGIYLAHQFNFALQHVDGCTLVHSKDNLRNSILSHLDESDYGLFVLGPFIAKFLGGFPFTLECSNGKCNHQRDTRISLPRIINYDRNGLTTRQIEILEKYSNSNTLTEALYAEYKSEHKKIKESRILIIEDKKASVYFDLEHCNIGTYIDSSSEWVREVEDTNNVIMSTMATEVQRRKHLRTRAEARRLLRYAHMVKAIVTVDEHGAEFSVTDRAEIKHYLNLLSAKPSLVASIEEGIENFIVHSQLSLIGYMAYTCESCGKEAEVGEEFVPISPDTLFFTLAQQVSSLYQMLADRAGA